MSTILVTGGAGFIGSNIVEELLLRGEKVRVLDNLSTGKRENIKNLTNNSDFEFIEGDIRSYHIVLDAVVGIDFILHQAALPSVPRSVKDPINTNDVNVGGTLNILDAARRANVKRVVFASSSSVYGNSPTLPKVETMVVNPLSPYANSKLAGEYYCRIFSRIYGLETVILRYFNVFGLRQDPTSQYSAVIPKFISAMSKGESPTIYGDGLQSRDFTYIANVVSANILACTAEDAIGEVFNVACGHSYSLVDLVNGINKILEKDIKPIFAKEQVGDVKHSLANITKAKEILRYEPLVSFENGLKEFLKQCIRDGEL